MAHGMSRRGDQDENCVGSRSRSALMIATAPRVHHRCCYISRFLMRRASLRGEVQPDVIVAPRVCRCCGHLTQKAGWVRYGWRSAVWTPQGYGAHTSSGWPNCWVPPPRPPRQRLLVQPGRVGCQRGGCWRAMQNSTPCHFWPMWRPMGCGFKSSSVPPKRHDSQELSAVGVVSRRASMRSIAAVSASRRVFSSSPVTMSARARRTPAISRAKNSVSAWVRSAT